MSPEAERWLQRRRILKTEEEWRACEFPEQIARLFQRERVGDRKARLLAAACLRRLWDWPPVASRRWAVELLERQADGPVPAAEGLAAAAALREARLSTTDVMGGMYWQMSSDYSEENQTDPWRTGWSSAEAMVVAAARRAQVSDGLPDGRPDDKYRLPEERVLCGLLRCLLGNPFRTVALDPACASPTAVALAFVACEHRVLPGGTLDPARLAVLADALQDAGCADVELLNHCRGPGPHIRGCWALDLILGKA
jgi:hypothetical protein